MINIEKKTDCCGCHACFNICPKDAIEMKEDEYGFKYPVINQEKCIECGMCKKVCPIINKEKIINEPKTYACINKNEEIRLNSSSGGIFTLIAETILELNGVVFAAQFDDNFNVIHSYVNSKEELYKFRGSKYVQSIIGDTFKKVKKFLEQGKYVLFTGTPCQVEGLYSFLQKDYENLYTQDIICHGVPSPKVWKEYINFRKKIDTKNPIEISFRNKDEGWKLFNLKFKYNEGEYKKNQNTDVYMKAFLNNVSLRDSCYNCNFKKVSRISDITLADFWGIQKIMPKIDDDKGTSLVILNSEKGKKLFEKIKEKIDFKEVNFEEAIKYNPSMIKSVIKPQKRDSFFRDLENLDFNELEKKYFPEPKFIFKVIRKIKFKMLNIMNKCKKIIKYKCYKY